MNKSSIKKKIIAINLLISLLIILSGFSIITLNYVKDIKKEIVHNVLMEARLVAEYCTAALTFQYPDKAEELLSKLSKVPGVENGFIFDENRKLFASYNREDKKIAMPSSSELLLTYQKFQGDYLYICEPIIYKERKYGTIYLVYFTSLTQKLKSHFTIIISLIIALLFFSYFLASSLQKVISTPILELAHLSEKISSDGNYSLRISKDRGDEIGLLYKAFNNMLDVIQSRNLEIEKQNRIKTVQSELNEKLRGEHELETLGTNVISFLAKSINAYVGAVYICEYNILRLIGVYGTISKKKLKEKYYLGEGLVGQAAMDKNYLYITNSQDDCLIINYGLGEEILKNVIIFPLEMNNNVKGVVVLGALNKLPDLSIQLLELVSESIAISFNSQLSRKIAENLLIQTQNQAEELQVSEEELKQINEELGKQAKALEKQKLDIENKNKDLESAHKIIEEKAKDLEISNKYKSEFLANMSHELRTPLNSILLLSKILSGNKEGNLKDEQIESAKIINSSGSELLSLINDVLDLSKIEAGKVEVDISSMNLKEFAFIIKKNFEHLAQDKGLKLNVYIEDNLPETIEIDQQKVHQIVKNFISNSLKFTHKGGVINFRISRPKNEEIELKNKGFDPVSTLSFYVVDTGIGIPYDKQKLIFEAFQQADGTTSRKYGGTGLGLSISRELAKVIGGLITLESVYEKGSTFAFHIPLSFKGEVVETKKQTTHEIVMAAAEEITDRLIDIDSAPETGEFIRDDRRRITAKDKSILIIEDDNKFAKILRDISREHGFKCVIAENGKIGLQFAEYYKPNAIILDIRLPDIDGWTVIDRLKENLSTRHIPVHFISITDNKFDAFKAGAIDFLTKPVSMDQLGEMYGKIDEMISKTVKELLIVEDNTNQANAIAKLVENANIHHTIVSSAKEAYNCIISGKFDCVILDIGLPDMSGIQLLTKIRNEEEISHIPIIVYTGKELTSKEKTIIDKYAESIVIKGENSSERLIDETSLFLHLVNDNLPENQKNMLVSIHDQESILMNRKIMLVDDDMRNVFSLKKLLEDKGIKISIAKNGKKCLQLLNEVPDIDLILMDIMMPEMDGYETMKEIRNDNRFKKLPIISLTAKAMRGDRNKCIEAGASDYMSKPVDIDRLFSMLRVWLY